MDAAERLSAIEEIRQLKARYFRCLDTKDWAGFFALFTQDAVLDQTQAEMDHTITGAQAIADTVSNAVASAVTVHHGHMSEIEILSATTARGIWAMEDKLWWPESAPIQAMHGYGHYHEDYACVEGEWRIAVSRLTRLRFDTEPS